MSIPHFDITRGPGRLLPAILKMTKAFFSYSLDVSFRIRANTLFG